MKQKYAIIRDDAQKTLVVREYAELDKEMMSLLCEESYSQEAMSAAINEGHQAVIDAIRTNNMYPPTVFAEPIAQAIEGIFAEGGNSSAELFFDDKELFIKEPEEVDADIDAKDDDVAVDDLLEEDDDIDDGLGDGLGDEKVVAGIKSKVKVTEDENSDADSIG
jgi:hypothetical protein